MAFKDAVRPNFNADKSRFECPSGFVPCNGNSQFYNGLPTQAEYVTCRPTEKTSDEYCPITSFSFDNPLTDLSEYQEKKLLRGGVEVVNRSLWYSKSVL